MSFYIMPDEILIIIFNYCEVHDLIRLNGVCKRFYWVTSELLNKESHYLLVTSERSEKFRRRCQPLLSSYKSKFSTYYNWKHGRFKSKIFYSKFVPLTAYSWKYFELFEEIKYKNGLQMTKDMVLFASDINNLCAFNRKKNGSVSDDNWIIKKCTSEIMDIVLCNDIIVTNHRDGSIRQWTIESLDGRQYFNEKLLRSSCLDNSYINYVMDVTSRNIVTGSYEGEIEIWKYIPQENSIVDKYIIPNHNLDLDLKLCVELIAFDPTGTKFAAWFSTNNAGYYIIYDINKRYTEKRMEDYLSDDDLYNPNQILWENPNTILLLNEYTITKMDVRTHKAVQKWNNLDEDNYTFDHESLTCMSSDNQYAIITGTSYGKLILWDQRQNASIQTYNINSHVDCLQFDSSHMYVAGNQIYEFDFSHK